MLAYWYREDHGKTHQWIGILIITIGITLLTVNRLFSYDDWDRKKVLTGILLTIFGYYVKSVSMSITDYNFRSLNNPALSVAGRKSFYGLLVTSLLYIPLNFLKLGPPFQLYLDDIKEVPAGIKENPVILIFMVMLLICSTFYEATASILMKNSEIIDRIVTDALRVVPIAIVSLIFGWEPFSIVMFATAIVIFFGLFVYRYESLLKNIYKSICIRPRSASSADVEDNSVTQSSPTETEIA